VLPFLDWGAPLVEGRFLRRPNRFVVHAEVDGKGEVVAHLADPGRLKELLVPGRRMGLRPEPPSETRSTRWTALLVEAEPQEGIAAPPAHAGAADPRAGRYAPRGGARPLHVREPDPVQWVSVNTTLPNRLVRAALAEGALEEFAGWSLVRWEAPYGSSRLDFLLDDARGRKMYLEAKSVTLVQDGVALFPDAVTARGARHVHELMAAVEEGHEAAVLFVLQRPDASRIVAARAIDPAFAQALERARDAGVRILGRRCSVGWEGIRLGERVEAGPG